MKDFFVDIFKYLIHNGPVALLTVSEESVIRCIVKKNELNMKKIVIKKGFGLTLEKI